MRRAIRRGDEAVDNEVWGLLPEEFTGFAGRAELIGDRDQPLAALVADRGTAAETDDFFRSRPFYDAEGVTHTLRIEGARLGDRIPAAGPRDRRHRAVRRDLAIRVSRAPRCGSSGARRPTRSRSTGPGRDW